MSLAAMSAGGYVKCIITQIPITAFTCTEGLTLYVDVEEETSTAETLQMNRHISVKVLYLTS